MAPDAEHADAPPDEAAPVERGLFSEKVRDTLVVVILSVTTVLTAWTGFQSSKWGGEMSIAFSQGSTARIEAARYAGEANAARQADLTIWAIYVNARATEDERLATYVEERFTPHFRVAYDAWLAAGEGTRSPFALDVYVPPGTTEAAAAQERAEERYNQALRNNQRGDDYTLLTVILAVVLFFAAVSGRLGRPSTRWFMLGLAYTVLLGGVVVLAALPVNL